MGFLISYLNFKQLLASLKAFLETRANPERRYTLFFFRRRASEVAQARVRFPDVAV